MHMLKEYFLANKIHFFHIYASKKIDFINLVNSWLGYAKFVCFMILYNL